MLDFKLFCFLMFLAASPVFGVVASAQAQEPVQVQIETQVPATRLNINQADAQTLLRELSGIGPAKAQAIVDHRSARGDFKSVDELLEVKGIGVATLERIRNQLTVE